MAHPTLSQMAGSVGAPRPPRPMERISEAADRVNVTIQQVQGILARIQNAETGHGAECPDTICVSYLDQIGRLHGNLDVLGKLVDELVELV